MAAVRRDADGWKDRVEFMRTAMHYSLYHLTDQEAVRNRSLPDKIVGSRFRATKIPRRYAGIQNPR